MQWAPCITGNKHIIGTPNSRGGGGFWQTRLFDTAQQVYVENVGTCLTSENLENNMLILSSTVVRYKHCVRCWLFDIYCINTSTIIINFIIHNKMFS